MNSNVLRADGFDRVVKDGRCHNGMTVLGSTFNGDGVVEGVG